MKTSQWKSLLFYIVFIMPSIMMIGCGGDDADTATTSPPVTTTTDGEKNLPASGGVVSITDKNSPIYGAEINIPTDTLVDGEKISLSYENQLPAPLNAKALAQGAVPISKTLVLTRTGTIDFGQSVSVTIPYDKTKFPKDGVPIVIYWDETNNTYSPIAIKSIDETKGTITFLTAHASKYVVIAIDFLAGVQAPDMKTLTASVDFDPQYDSFFMRNFGSYDAPGGNCFGMAAYSAWYRQSHKSSPRLVNIYKEGDQQKEEDDQTARELIARVYQAGDQKTHIAALNDVRNFNSLTRELKERFVALSIIKQLIVTDQAQIFVMGVGTFSNWKDGHAVTVYKYDGVNKTFLYYDNNYPKEVVSVPWDWNTGFGNNSKDARYDLYAFASFNSAYSPATLANFYQAAQAGFPSSHYPKISISKPVETNLNSGTYEVPEDKNIEIIGTVAKPTSSSSQYDPSAPRYIHVYLNGTQYGSYPVDASSNQFNIPVAKLPNPTGTDVMLLVSQNPKRWAGGFHAFKQFKVKVKNESFFKNLGFETGTFSDWISTRHLWGNTNVITPSDKSSVISNVAFDSIATDLPTPLFGKYVGRVNNQDPDYHISTITQKAVVPATKNPVVKFYWAAVLEDPDHPPEDQPYVDVSLVDDQTGATLYSKRFYSNDPKYSGWKSYQGGAWKSIPWQLVEVPVAQYVGHTLTLKVEAADCGQGAHGGYVYVDAEE